MWTPDEANEENFEDLTDEDYEMMKRWEEVLGEYEKKLMDDESL